MSDSEKDDNKDKSQDPKPSESSEEVTIPRAEYEKVLGHVKELEETKERLMLAAADFENAKKRLAREREEYVKFSQEKLIGQLLPVLDNFSRALAHAGEGDEKAQKGLISGIQMVFKQLQDALSTQGLKRVPSLGETFDPHKHEAIGHISEEGPADEVVEEIEAGYFLHDRLLRAAKVRVRIPPSAPTSDPSTDPEKTEELT